MHLRPVRPSDRTLVAAFHERQSPESIYFRYFSPRPRLNDADLERLTQVDYLDRMAFVGLIGSDLVGIARYDRYPTTEVAEIAFFTDEAHRGRGVATILLEYLAAAAREAGLAGFVAQVLPENRRMLSVFSRAGFEVQSAFTDGIIEVSLGIEPTDEARRIVAERARSAFTLSVQRLLSPKTVAVVGASRQRDSIGYLVFRNILEGGFAGTVYPVNRVADEIDGVTAYSSIHALPEPVDIAVVCVPRDEVPGVVAACARRHVHGLVIITAGFSDLDESGTLSEEAIVTRARRWGMRVLGPNSMGVINTDPEVGLSATFVDVHPRAGRIGVSSKSGTLGAAIIEHAARLGLGISTFVSLGNQADVSNNDLLGYWANDESTNLVLLYLESFGDPSNFARSTRVLARTKPVVAVKSGRALPLDAAGTGLPASANADALLAQIGLIRVDTLAELLDVALVLTRQPIPRGRRLAVLSNARSPALLAIDAALGVDLALADVMVDGHANPIDLGFDATPEVFASTLKTLCEHAEVDAVVVLCTPSMPGAIDEFERRIVEVAASSPVPIVATYLGLKPANAPGGDSVLPVFAFPEAAVRSLGRIAAYGEWLRRDAGALPAANLVDLDALEQARQTFGGAEGWLDHDASLTVIASTGTSLVTQRVVQGVDEAVLVANEIGWPVALKAGGLARPVKTEAGGVAVDVHDAAELRHAHERMVALLGDGMDSSVVQQMAVPGVDVRIGLVRSGLVGPVVTLEVDRAFLTEARPPGVQVVPCTDLDAAAMLQRAGLLDALQSPQAALIGIDQSTVDDVVHSVTRLVQAISVLVDLAPEIAAIVLDPVIVSADGAVVTDVRVRLSRPDPREELPVRRLGDG